MRQLNSLNNWLAGLEGRLLCLFLLTMIFLSFTQVVVRNLFSTGILWADAVVRMLVLWVGLLGATLATHMNQHLSIDCFTKFFGGRSKKALGLFIRLFAIFVCYYLMKASYRFMMMEKSGGSEFFEGIPNWFVEAVIPVCFALIAFHYLVMILNDFRDLFLKKS